MTDTVATERHGHVLLIGLNRPDKLNAFDVGMIRQLADAYTELARDRQLRCGVLWVQGRYFTSGLDPGSLVRHLPVEVASRITRHIPLVELLTPAISRGKIDPWGVSTPPCPKPVVTAVHGPCYTLGIELMLSAQVNIAGEETTFTQYEVGRGLLPFAGARCAGRWPWARTTPTATCC
jgi:enoyl-CoA hydratase